jgi:hypothetical protein
MKGKQDRLSGGSAHWASSYKHCLSILNISCYAIPGQWDFVIEKNSIYSDFEW